MTTTSPLGPASPPTVLDAAASEAPEATRAVTRARRNRKASSDDGDDRSAVSASDWRRPSVRWTLGPTHWLLLVLLVVWCVGPLLLLAKFAVTPTQDILRTPMAIFPNGIAWSNLSEAWNDVQVSKYFVNTIVLAAGAWFSQILVATTGGYLLSVLRPR